MVNQEINHQNYCKEYNYPYYRSHYNSTDIDFNRVSNSSRSCNENTNTYFTPIHSTQTSLDYNNNSNHHRQARKIPVRRPSIIYAPSLVRSDYAAAISIGIGKIGSDNSSSSTKVRPRPTEPETNAENGGQQQQHYARGHQLSKFYSSPNDDTNSPYQAPNVNLSVVHNANDSFAEPRRIYDNKLNGATTNYAAANNVTNSCTDNNVVYAGSSATFAAHRSVINQLSKSFSSAVTSNNKLTVPNNINNDISTSSSTSSATTNSFMLHPTIIIPKMGSTSTLSTKVACNNVHNKIYQSKTPPPFIINGPCSNRKCSVSDVSKASDVETGSIYAASLTSTPHTIGGGSKATLSRRAQKLARKARSELSSSASAIYQLFTAGNTAENIYGSFVGNDYSSINGNSNRPSRMTNGIHNGSTGSQHQNAAANAIEEFFMDGIPDVVSLHTSRGLDFMEKFGQFLKERALIEEEYAVKIRNLVKKSRGKRGEDENIDAKAYSYVNAFNTMLTELDSLAGQHEVIGDNFKREIYPSIVEKCQTLRLGRKRCIQNFQQLKAQMEAKIGDLIKQERAYEKAHLDAQNAYLKWEKADKNLHISRLDLDKAKANAHAKSQLCEQAKQSYASEIATTNSAKHDYHDVQLPRLLEEFRRLDIDRIEATKSSMNASILAATGVSHIIQRCYDEMKNAVQQIDSTSDTQLVVEQGKTGYTHPEDFSFVDRGDPSTILHMNDGTIEAGERDHIDNGNTTLRKQKSMGANANNGKGVVRKSSMHQRLFGGSGSSVSKLNGSASNINGASSGVGEYGHLPPQQRCRKIHQKLEELEQLMHTKLQTKEGLEKMHAVYTGNPKLGDAKKVMEQLVEVRRSIDLLNVEMSRLKELFAHAQSECGVPLGGGHSSLSNSCGASSSTSQSSSPRSSNVSRITVGNGNGCTNIHPASLAHRASSISTHSDSSTSAVSVNDALSSSANKSQQQSNNATTSVVISSPSAATDLYEECDNNANNKPNGPNLQAVQEYVPLGTAVALYQYDGASDDASDPNTLAMREGDEVILLERDVGDGWTRVRHSRTNLEGFVPSTYIDCHWHAFSSAK